MSIHGSSGSSNSAYLDKVTKLYNRLKHADGAEAAKIEHQLGVLGATHELHQAQKIKDPEKRAKALHAIADDFERLGQKGRASRLELQAEALETIADAMKATR